MMNVQKLRKSLSRQAIYDEFDYKKIEDSDTNYFSKDSLPFKLTLVIIDLIIYLL